MAVYNISTLLQTYSRHVFKTLLILLGCSLMIPPAISTNGDERSCSDICEYHVRPTFADCRRLDLDRIPTNAGLCSQATIINLQNNQIEAVYPNDLIGYPSVRVLLMGYNNVSDISTNMFGNATTITQLQLNDNGIRSVPGEAFHNLYRLDQLHLDNNQIVELQLDAFDGLNSLDRLFLNDNAITNIPQGVFRDLKALTLLNVATNNIQAITGQLFTGLKNLQQLNLEYNKITTIGAESFSSLANLKLIKLGHNALTSLSAIVFADLPLETLFLNNNNLTTIKNVPNWLDSANTLTTLSLSGNPLHCNCDIEAIRLWYKEHNPNDDSTCASPKVLQGRQLVDLKQDLCGGSSEGLTSPKSSDASLIYDRYSTNRVGHNRGEQQTSNDNNWKIVIVVCVIFLVIVVFGGALFVIQNRRKHNQRAPYHTSSGSAHYSSVQVPQNDHTRTPRARMTSETQLMSDADDAYESYTIPPDAQQNIPVPNTRTSGQRFHNRAPIVKQASTGSATTSPDIAIDDNPCIVASSPTRPKFSLGEPIPEAELELEFNDAGQCTSFRQPSTSPGGYEPINLRPRDPPPPPPPKTSPHQYISTPLPVGTNTGYLPLPNVQKV